MAEEAGEQNQVNPESRLAQVKRLADSYFGFARARERERTPEQEKKLKELDAFVEGSAEFQDPGNRERLVATVGKMDRLLNRLAGQRAASEGQITIGNIKELIDRRVVKDVGLDLARIRWAFGGSPRPMVESFKRLVQYDDPDSSGMKPVREYFNGQYERALARRVEPIFLLSQTKLTGPEGETMALGEVMMEYSELGAQFPPFRQEK